MSNPVSKQVIDPANPFGSLTAGPQQFTFLADANHSDPAITKVIADHVGSMAKSGVRHIMLEYEQTHAGDRDLLRRLNNVPPLISDAEIMRYAPSLESASAATPEAKKQSGLEHARLLVEAKKFGIKVHFTGDSRGLDFVAQEDEVFRQEKIFRAQNKDLDKKFQQYILDKDFWSKQAGTEAEKTALNDKLQAYGTQLKDFFERRRGFRKQYEEARMSPLAEEERAVLLLSLANGEKTVAIWGRDHLNDVRDLNEILDEKLRQAYIMARITNPETASKIKPEPSRVMDLFSSRAYEREVDHAKGNQDSDLKYYVEEGEIELTPAGAARFDILTRAPARPSVFRP